MKPIQINASPGDRGKTFVLDLKVNGKTIDKRGVSLAHGQFARIVLRGKAKDKGVLSVEVS